MKYDILERHFRPYGNDKFSYDECNYSISAITGNRKGSIIKINVEKVILWMT